MSILLSFQSSNNIKVYKVNIKESHCCSFLPIAVNIYCPLPPPPLFRRKPRDMVFGFPECVVRDALFRVCNRYIVSATPPTVLDRFF